MWIVCLDDSHEISSPIFSRKKFTILSAVILTGLLGRSQLLNIFFTVDPVEKEVPKLLKRMSKRLCSEKNPKTKYTVSWDFLNKSWAFSMQYFQS